MKERILLLLAAALLLSVCWGLPCAAAEAKWPAGSSGGQKTNGKMTLDLTNITEGYFMAAVSEKTSHPMKLRVTKDGVTLTYNLNTDGNFEVFPLQLGSGTYDISLFENVSGKKFSNAGKISVNVALSREDGAFLYPNQYVNYNELTKAVAVANELCAGKNEKETFALIQKYITENYAYDFIKSVTVPAGELPDIDGCYNKKMGVCQDLSALTVCMLRSQGIPARLIVGYADKNYHVWTVTTVADKEALFDPTAALNAISKPSSYSVERYY
ncbi:MAG: transglutaminase domain-containing protein [Clostridia bacterium]|nr:transglutaminase domain-containing protein [Clostridia bacterium]